MRGNGWILVALAVVTFAGVGMRATPPAQLAPAFLAPLKIGMAVSVTQTGTEPAHLYVPSAEEAKNGGYWKVTNVGVDYVECQIGTSVWRIPAHSIARISWTSGG